MIDARLFLPSRVRKYGVYRQVIKQPADDAPPAPFGARKTVFGANRQLSDQRVTQPIEQRPEFIEALGIGNATLPHRLGQ